METPTLQKIRRKASRLLEDRLLRTGTVLAIRKWDDSSFVEIDLHLPAADMQLWQEVPFIKFRVDDFTYRYYTPSGWDAETRTCTIYADTGHEGPGAAWIRQLHKLDTVYYIRIGTTHKPAGAWRNRTAGCRLCQRLSYGAGSRPYGARNLFSALG